MANPTGAATATAWADLVHDLGFNGGPDDSGAF